MEQRQRRRWAGGMSLALSTALSASLAATGVMSLVSPAVADAGDGEVTVRVVREVNANGTWDSVLEPGLAGVQVVLTDDEGNSITGTTTANGTVKLDPGTSLGGGKYRVEVKNPDSKVYYPGMAKPRTSLLDTRDLSSNVEFVDLSAGKNVEITTSFWSPEDYCQQNATLVAACMNPMIPTPSPNSYHTLTSFPFNARGNDANLLTTLTEEGQTGTVNGIGYNRVTKQLFSAAFAKRGTKYGPGGPGAIYRTDPATKLSNLFTIVPNVGTTAHNPGSGMDDAFGAVVGKESLGDLDVSADGKDLYVVNLRERRLYRYDATNITAASQKASYSIPDPGCAANSDWRPFGLGIQDGMVYVGGVCSGESTGSKDDLRAVVYSFNPTTGQFTGKVMDQPLNFPRGGLKFFGLPPGTCTGMGWYPWTSARPMSQDGQACAGDQIQNPEPWLADITFETNGDMVVGFADRFTDRAGYNLPATSAGWPATTAYNGGDINRACRGGNHMFVLDGNGGCTNHATPANSGGQSPNMLEFYPGDVTVVNNPTGQDAHQEISSGGLALSKVETTLPFVALDPFETVTGSGVRWVDRFSGNSNQNTDGLMLHGLFGKTRGIGDLEVLCDEAPLQLGNRVWFDTDQDGIQDPGEKPVVGATVNLYDADGNKIGTATTNARGEYYFDSTVVKNVRPEDLKYGQTYTVKMDNPDDYEDGGVLDGWASTKPGAGDNDEIDSSGEPDGDPFPSVQVTPMGAGRNDHSLDFGFIKPSVDLSVVKVGPATVEPGGEVKYDIIITNNGPNDSTGYTVTDPLPDELTNVKTSSAGCGINNHILTCTGGPLKKGQSHTITVSGTAPMPPHPGITINNCVEVDGREPDPDPTNDKDCEPTIVPPIPVIDPTIGATAAALLALSGTLYIRRRNTTGETL
ncbi:SdrD B-like domain-containing protein [Streptomyces sp. NPDC093982]|uniref:SdrD B-like domain-containing protein n=1 Tax=Streptomyces sp. NPDC093982 TaxID=3155077 RepID=UPI0034126589